MQRKKLILRKESFGGLFVDTSTGESIFLSPGQYVQKKLDLLSARSTGDWVKFVDLTEKGYSLPQNATSSPRAMFFEITKKCNGSCVECFMDSNAKKWPKKEATLNEIKDILTQFSESGGDYIRLTGGEPTTRTDFFNIVEFIHKQGVRIGLNTNGLFGKEMLDRILATGINDIRVSLDGPEKLNDQIRGQGTYEKIIRTLTGISEYNKKSDTPVQLTINMVLMKTNKIFIEEMFNLAQKYNALISLGLLRPTGRARKEDMLTPEEIVVAAKKVQELRARAGLPKYKARINFDIFCEGAAENKGRVLGKYSPFPFDNSKCPLGSSGMTLDAFARLVPCGYFVNLERWIGEDVRGKDLLEIWYNSDILNQARNVTRACCKGCKYHIVKCNGGCPVMAYVFDGDLDGHDPYCVKDVNVSGCTK